MLFLGFLGNLFVGCFFYIMVSFMRRLSMTSLNLVVLHQVLMRRCLKGHVVLVASMVGTNTWELFNANELDPNVG